MAATYTDYAWIAETFPGWIETGYGLALVRDIEPGELLNRLGADPHRIVTVGVEGEGSLAADWEHGISRAVGAAMVDEHWCALAECHSGWVALDRSKIEPITADHEWIYHGTNINAVSHFEWWQAGSLTTKFEPGSGFYPDDDSFGSSDPHALTDVVDEVGGIRRDEDEPRGDHRAACFALAERITGVKLTAQQLHSIEFLTATVPEATVDPRPRGHQFL